MNAPIHGARVPSGRYTLPASICGLTACTRLSLPQIVRGKILEARAVENKAQAIADLKSGDLKLQSASLDGAKVQVYGDTAVVTYSSNDKGTYKGKDISGKTRWTDVFVNHNGPSVPRLVRQFSWS